MSLLDDIRAYLVSVPGIVSTTWPCYEGYFPDDQDTMIGIFETGGYPAAELNRENERVTFQTRVRADRLNYAVARQKWLDIFKALQDSTPASGYFLVQAIHYGPMFFNDDQGRPNFTTNWRVIKVAS